ncbi:DUF3574 domain-containing protein [Pseudoalteromonas luteoviolacea]|uniref:DUF3574 domain-containing protein n=1 Tax=Pseudoalteromonas luteoviolacea NCIMB 1942 TaxID=1365253 RepID=A0A167BXP9_9GAMM|nr:DUF3574 domain-containing protein [Pseudoalteromonas luteoviolacea]KZN47017.1 hypothetical protein N482_02030 [Pseudoalteromonas luteoviolacea NCIMB 1942]KZW99397.1 hypothetical protein JL49_17445 [Pseudoalteromonas luteoviolacea]
MHYRTLFVYSAIALLSGCMTTNSSPVSKPPAVSSNNQGIKMYFGLSKPNGGVISQQQWLKFETGHLARAFEGFALVDSTGYYKGSKEGSKIVTLYNATAHDLATAKELAREYCRLFGQDSVLVVQLGVKQIQFVGKE